MKKVNFNAGPSILPQEAIKGTAEAIRDFAGTGLSILEVSHRSKEFDAIMIETVALFKELLGVPEGYGVIFVGGGASTQFFHVPYNMLEKKAAYLVTGTWAKKALKEAKLFGETVVVASSEDENFTYIPKNYTIPSDADYFHITTNNTIYGTELLKDIDSPVPLVADMSSDILSRPVDISKYALIYGGAQKNFAPAGVTFVIAREDALGKVSRPLPSMVDYRTHIKENSMYNTPPCVSVYTGMLTLRWLKNLGGLPAIDRLNQEKSDLLYNAIDASKHFVGTVAKEDRSRMNITFVMKPGFENLEEEFLNLTKKNGLVGLKGHRSVGGFRASIYNAMPIEGVQRLVDTIKEFEAAH